MWSTTSSREIVASPHRCTDRVALNQWYPLAAVAELRAEITYQTLLLGESLRYGVSADGQEIAWRTTERDIAAGSRLPSSLPQLLPSETRFGYLWTTLGDPPKLFTIPEIDEPDRRVLNAGTIGIATSGPRAVENFLDMGHFPFVHTDVLGAEPHTEVVEYDVNIVDGEVLATGCRFPQPKAAAGAAGGMVTDYVYRVPHPYCTILYKSCPFDESRQDVIGLFVQPLDEEHVRASMLLGIVDPVTSDTEIRRFQLGIFSQDKPILENQVPKRLPLSPSAETPIRADKSAIVYRRWLSEMGLTYGVIPAAEGT
jgi:phenylpropionate dioxygenase-like ring-hydroxylating dioxygenase large terminal subunit